MNDRPEPAITSPKNPSPMPHATAVGDELRWSRATQAHAAPPALEEGCGAGTALVAPRSRRMKASMPTARRTIVTTATSPSDAQSNRPASGTWLIVQPNQVRLANGASSGIASW